MKAQDFLRKGADLLEERGKQYDQPGGERSMGKAVSAFNTITGRSLSEAEGWLLLQILKDVRQWQNPDKYHADSAEDCVSYAALKAESLASGVDEYIDKFDDFGAPLPLESNEEFEVTEISHPSLGTLTYLNGELVHTEEPAAAIDDDSARAKIVQQNGEMATEVYAAIDGWIEWSGGDRPVSRGTIVDVRFCDGSEDTDSAGSYGWDHSGKTYSIAAYRPTKEA